MERIQITSPDTGRKFDVIEQADGSWHVVDVATRALIVVDADSFSDAVEQLTA